MTTSTDTVLEKAEARLQFHRGEAEKHAMAAGKIETSISALKELIDELDEDFEAPVEVAQIEAPADEPKPTKTIDERVADQFDKTPHMPVKEVAELLDLSPQQIYNTQHQLGFKFGQPTDFHVGDDGDQPEADEPDEPDAPDDEVDEPPAPINGADVPRMPIPQHVSRAKQPAGTKFHLRDRATGKYLHEDLTSMCSNGGELHLVDAKTYAWCGPESKLLYVRRTLPDTMDLVEEPVIAP